MYFLSVLYEKSDHDLSQGKIDALMRTQYEVYTTETINTQCEWIDSPENEMLDYHAQNYKNNFISSTYTLFKNKIDFQVTKVSNVDLIEYTFTTESKDYEVSYLRYEIEIILAYKRLF